MKNIGRNPIVDCERNGERVENNRKSNQSPIRKWKSKSLYKFEV